MRVKNYPLECGKMDILSHFYSIKVHPNSNLSYGRINFLAMTLPEILSHVAWVLKVQVTKPALHEKISFYKPCRRVLLQGLSGQKYCRFQVIFSQIFWFYCCMVQQKVPFSRLKLVSNFSNVFNPGSPLSQKGPTPGFSKFFQVIFCQCPGFYRCVVRRKVPFSRFFQVEFCKQFPECFHSSHLLIKQALSKKSPLLK